MKSINTIAIVAAVGVFIIGHLVMQKIPGGIIDTSIDIDSKAKAVAVTAFTMATIDPQLVDVDTEVDGDVCPNCGGTGKVGDGRITKTCSVCKGTGKAVASTMDPSGQVNLEAFRKLDEIHSAILGIRPPVTASEAPKEAPKDPPKAAPARSTLIVHCFEGCAPCERFMREEAPKFQAAGWVVEKRMDSGDKPAPWFTTYDGELQFEWKAGLTLDGYLKWKDGQRK